MNAFVCCFGNFIRGTTEMESPTCDGQPTRMDSNLKDWLTNMAEIAFFCQELGRDLNKLCDDSQGYYPTNDYIQVVMSIQV